MSINWLTGASPSPAILVLPPAAASLDEAHAAIELWEFYKRRTLDPTQRLMVEVMMATRSDGLWAAPTTGREMPRQNGKGDEVEVVELWGLVQRSERILHTIHDAVLLATETQSRMLSVIDGHPDLSRLKLRAWRGTGQQMIEMRNGGIIWYRTRTGGGARGVDEVDRIVIDEAQHAEEEHISAVSPTLLVSANPQMNALGSAGITDKSVWWWRQRLRALSDTPGDFGYVGHTAEVLSLDADKQVVSAPVNVHDREVWRRSNPALLRRPELVGFLEEQLSRLGDQLFAREHLGVWDPQEGSSAKSVKLPLEAWTSCCTIDPLPDGPVMLAFEVSPDSEWASVAVAGGDQTHPYIELVEHRKALGWVPQRLVELVERSEPVRVAAIWNGPAGALVGPVLMAFAEAGLTVQLEQLQMPAYRQACAAFYADVVEGRLSWFTGSGPLDVAAKDAAARQVGDAWQWDIRNVTVPISPLVAATVARALLPVEVPKKPPGLARVISF